MKLIKKLSLVASAFIALSVWTVPSYANNFFWEFNVGTGEFRPESGTTEDLTVLSGAYGGFITNAVAYELQVGAGWEDQGNFGGSPDVSHAAALIGFNIGPRDAHIFLMGGVGIFDISTAINDTDGEGAALGFGLNLYASQNSGLSFEALNIKDDDNGEYGLVSLGYKKKF